MIQETHISPDMKNIPNVANFVKEYLCAMQPGTGFASPTATPLTRAINRDSIVTL